MNSVGMAIAEAHLAAMFNRPGHEIVDHHTYAFCSDGDLMEGASHEAASLAGHLGLGKLVWVYDDNHITIEGDTKLAYSDDVPGRFEAYGWHVQDLGDKANDLDALTAALETARDETERPSLIIVRSHIGWGAPNKQDTASAHGSPLGEEEIARDEALLRLARGRDVPRAGARAASTWRRAVERGRELRGGLGGTARGLPEGPPETWRRSFERRCAASFRTAGTGRSPSSRPDEGPMATREGVRQGAQRLRGAGPVAHRRAAPTWPAPTRRS